MSKMTREELARDLAASIEGAKPGGIAPEVVDHAKRAPQPAMHGGRAKASPRPLTFEGTIVDSMVAHAEDRSQHPGRAAGASEATLRPKDPEVVTADEQHLRSERTRRIAELYAAAAVARRAREQVELLAVVAEPAAIELARAGAADARRHLASAGDVRELGPAAFSAVSDAWAVCTQLVMTTQKYLYRRSTGIESLEETLHALQMPPGWKIESLDHIERLGKRSRTAERDTAPLVVTIPIERAASVLDAAIDGFRERKNTNDPTPGPSLDDAKEAVFFGPAAREVTQILGEVDATIAATPTLVATDPAIRQASARYLAAAQRFADWSMGGTPLAPVAERVAGASEGFLRWAQRAPVEVRASVHGPVVRGQLEDKKIELLTSLDLVFKAQLRALDTLADEPEPERGVPWTARLFASIAKIGLAAVIGGPAGAAGALAGALVSGRGTGTEGGIGNAVESAVGELVGQLLEQRAVGAVGETRRRFFQTQVHVLTDYQRIAGRRLVQDLVDEAAHRPDGAELLKRALRKLELGSARIAAEQQQRAVQDWASYRSRIVHGVEAGGSTDLVGTGTGVTEGTAKPVSERDVPTGVLELFVSLNRGTPIISRARAGDLRADDAAKLATLRLSGVTMPVQFVFHHDGGQVIVSRNERGVLWLRSAGPEGRRVFTSAFGGTATDDGDVLRGAAMLIADMGHLRVPVVEAA